jgi:hypothetical protein
MTVSESHRITNFGGARRREKFYLSTKCIEEGWVPSDPDLPTSDLPTPLVTVGQGPSMAPDQVRVPCLI